MCYPTTKIECVHCKGKDLDLDYMAESDETSGRLVFLCDDCHRSTVVTFVAIEKDAF